MSRAGITLDHLVLVSPAPYVLLLILNVSGWLGPEPATACLFLLLLVRISNTALSLAQEADIWVRTIVGALEASASAEARPPSRRLAALAQVEGPKLAQVWTRALSDLLETDGVVSGPMGQLLWPIGINVLEFCLGAVCSMAGAAQNERAEAPLVASGRGAILAYAGAHPEDCLGGGVFPSAGADPALEAIMGGDRDNVWELEGVRMYDASEALSANYGSLPRERLPGCLGDCDKENVASRFVIMASRGRSRGN